MHRARRSGEAGFTSAEVVVFCVGLVAMAYIAYSSWQRFHSRGEFPWLLVSLLAMWACIGFGRYLAFRRSRIRPAQIESPGPVPRSNAASTGGHA